MDRGDTAELAARLARLEARYELLKDFAVGGVWHALNRLYDGVAGPQKLSCVACGKALGRRRVRVRQSQCVFGGGPLERLECPACGCVFGPLSVLGAPSEWLSADYRLLYAFYSEGDSTEPEIRTFEALGPKPGGLYLNWGCGAWSRSVEVLRERGYDVWGYEPNAAVERPFIVRTRGEVSAKFDGIFSNNVIEHMTDPLGELEDLKRQLKPDGRMAHASPCFEWAYDYTRFHVFFPLGASLDRLAARAGLKIMARQDEGEYHVRVLSRA